MVGGSDSDSIKIGPFGKTIGEHSWDGKGHGNIVQIFVRHDTWNISSIQYQYVENGKMMLSELHGNPRAGNFAVVNLNYPKEYITGIRGYYDSSGIFLITFSTNLGEYGPFGDLRPRITRYQHEEFSVKLGENRQFFGFYGTTNGTSGSLTSIGLYMKLKTDLDLVKKERIN